MIKNFITDIDLTPYYPAITKLLYTGETTFATRRMQAFDLVLDDFRFRGVDVRRLHFPIDLNRPTTTTSSEDVLMPFTKTAAFTSEYVLGLQGFKRFVVGISAITGGYTYTIEFQGSNDLADTPSTWQTIGTSTLSSVGNTTIVSQVEYKFYRYILTITSGGSITFNLGLYETYVDRLIIYKTFQLIFRNLIIEPGDMWEIRYKDAVNDYEMVMQTAKYYVDEGNNLPEEGEDTGSNAITFMR
jgi:hypothetical protein